MKRQKKSQMTKKLANYKKAIKEKCYDCMCGQKKIDCEINHCSLYPYRPFRKRSNEDCTKNYE